MDVKVYSPAKSYTSDYCYVCGTRCNVNLPKASVSLIAKGNSLQSIGSALCASCYEKSGWSAINGVEIKNIKCWSFQDFGYSQDQYRATCPNCNGSGRTPTPCLHGRTSEHTMPV